MFSGMAFATWPRERNASTNCGERFRSFSGSFLPRQTKALVLSHPVKACSPQLGRCQLQTTLSSSTCIDVCHRIQCQILCLHRLSARNIPAIWRHQCPETSLQWLLSPAVQLHTSNVILFWCRPIPVWKWVRESQSLLHYCRLHCEGTHTTHHKRNKSIDDTSCWHTCCHSLSMNFNSCCLLSYQRSQLLSSCLVVIVIFPFYISCWSFAFT